MFNLGQLMGMGGSILGGLMGANGQATGQSDSGPWKHQAPFLRAGFQTAAGLMKDQIGSPYYTGMLYAGMNPMQQAAGLNASRFASGMGTDLSRNMLRDSRSMLKNIGAFNRTANKLANIDPNNPTQGVIRSAQAYMDNPAINGAIDAASRDVTRNLTEDVLPEINRGAVSGSNTNSTRTGIAEGVALRGAQDRIGDISSTIRADAYQQGLNLAEQQRQANLQAKLTGLSQGGNMLNSAIGRGMDLRNQGIQNQVNMFDLMGRAGDRFQQDQQGYANAAFQRWQGQQDQPWNILSKYMGTVGGSQYGSTNTTSRPGSFGGMLQGILGGGATGLGLYKDFSSILNSGSAYQPQGLY